MSQLMDLVFSARGGIVLDWVGSFIMTGSLWLWINQVIAERLKQLKGGALREAAVVRHLRDSAGRMQWLPAQGDSVPLRKRTRARILLARVLSGINWAFLNTVKNVLEAAAFLIQGATDGVVAVVLFLFGLSVWTLGVYVSYSHASW